MRMHAGESQLFCSEWVGELHVTKEKSRIEEHFTTLLHFFQNLGLSLFFVFFLKKGEETALTSVWEVSKAVVLEATTVNPIVI